MRYISEALDQYTGICKEDLHDCASKLSKSFESVIIEVLLLYMVIPGKINFTGPLRQALRTVLPPELRSPSLEEPELAALQRRPCPALLRRRGAQGHRHRPQLHQQGWQEDSSGHQALPQGTAQADRPCRCRRLLLDPRLL